MSVVDYQEKLRTKSCALFLKLRFWIPPCAKPVWGEERRCDTATHCGPTGTVPLPTAWCARGRRQTLLMWGGGTILPTAEPIQ